MIRTRGLCFSYGGGGAALEDVNLAAASGAIVVLAGTNGSGKSTLLSLLAGLHAPTSGSIETGECVVGGPKADTRCLRNTVALVLQDADLQVLGSTAREDMSLGFAPDDPQAAERVRKMADRFGLAHCLDEPVQTLSYGQKRKLCLASVLLNEPQPTVLLLDEPFAGLDYPAIVEMRRILAQGREAGLTQIVAAHDLEPVVDLAQSMVVLAKGRLVLSGAPCEVLGSVREHGVRPPCSWGAGQALEAYE